jgi:hypothetical protein
LLKVKRRTSEILKKHEELTKDELRSFIPSRWLQRRRGDEGTQILSSQLGSHPSSHLTLSLIYTKVEQLHLENSSLQRMG